MSPSPPSCVVGEPVAEYLEACVGSTITWLLSGRGPSPYYWAPAPAADALQLSYNTHLNPQLWATYLQPLVTEVLVPPCDWRSLYLHAMATFGQAY